MKHNVWKILAFLLVPAITGCGPGLEEKRKNANVQYELGAAEFGQGNIKKALEAFEEARRLYPDDPRIYNAFGLVFYQQQDYQQAITQFRKALSLDPDFAEAHNNLGSTYADLKRWDEAIVEFRDALSDPMYRTPQLAHYNLGLALMEKGALVEAVKEFHAAIGIQSNFTQALDKYGVALFRLNRIQEAIKQFKQALEVDPEYVVSNLNLGLAYMKQGKQEEAIEQFKHVVEHSTDEELTMSARRYLEILE